MREIEDGNEDANLGGGVYKQRVERPGQGKSGAFRTIILFRSGIRSVFAYGFAKNERDNISGAELVAFKKLADIYLTLDDTAIDKLLAEGRLTELVGGADEEADGEKDDEYEENCDEDEQTHKEGDE